MSRHYYQKPGKLKVEHTFKKAGKNETITCKIGKKVWVDAHANEFGKYVVWSAISNRAGNYSVVEAEKLHEIVDFEEKT